MAQYDRLCPWCHTEIVWDPELGPEDTCPHCYNELGDYRSVSLKVRPPGNPSNTGENETDEDEIDDELEDDIELDEYEGDDTYDDYEEGVQRILDVQEEAPECSSCHSFMLFAGKRTSAPGFVPDIPAKLKKPLLNPSYTEKVYVCPSCFKIEHVAGDDDRLAMIELLREYGKNS